MDAEPHLLFQKCTCCISLYDHLCERTFAHSRKYCTECTQSTARAPLSPPTASSGRKFGNVLLAFCSANLSEVAEKKGAVKNTSASHDDRRATIYPAMSASGSQNARCPRALRPPIRLVVSHQAQARQHCNHTQLLQKRLSNYLLELQCLTGTRPVENVIPGSRRSSKEPLANG